MVIGYRLLVIEAGFIVTTIILNIYSLTFTHQHSLINIH